MKIRRVNERDSEGVMRLLRQVNDVHADGRPDLFVHGRTKYSPEELMAIFSDEDRPVFVAADEDDRVVGYCFCVVEDYSGSNNLQPVKTLYIDDLCVDENCRGRGIGRQLFEWVVDYGRLNGFYNVTLNVWACNPGAQRFYESLGMRPLKTGMETIL